MKLAVCIVVALLAPASVAAFECPFGQGKEGLIDPVRWSAKDGALYTSIGLGVTSTFDKPIVMVDAGVWFVDRLDRPVQPQGLELDPDLTIPAKGSVITYFDALGMDRLVGAKFEDFASHICTRAVLFEDSTKAEF